MTDHETVQQIPTPQEATSILWSIMGELALIAEKLHESSRRLKDAEIAWELHYAKTIQQVDGKSADIRKAQCIDAATDIRSELIAARNQIDAWRSAGQMARSKCDAARSMTSGLKSLTD